MSSKVQAAGIFIINREKKLLVCHPTNHKVDFYSIPKGKVEENEAMIDAALRETWEETNIDLATSDSVCSFHVHHFLPVQYKHGKKVLNPFVYIEHICSRMDWSEIEIKCNSYVDDVRGQFPEMDGYKWVTLDEARTLLHDTQVKCLDIIENLINTRYDT